MKKATVLTAAAMLLLVPVLARAADAAQHPYVKAVREFADNVIKHGRDVYGPKKTPLFVDGVNVDTREPGKLGKGERAWILCNLACQQNLMRTLDGLSKVTGEPKYRETAVEATTYMPSRTCAAGTDCCTGAGTLPMTPGKTGPSWLTPPTTTS